ncbi:FtsK/SpoIIIE domain-containing protein [Olsenella sp. YH-ols2217]|uniref:FtsK/SpoIIIE domain-containing protein n=1 Tax=Kribbibacterium absianum TaxID=3044210 RepID=A0ABT6ZL84_9ACTN|nr:MULTISPECIES: FtsK/SpoIIIE domain-containing protein [unclassified Olsenella]MDJ1121806.1 FtsK/SpoIIIE domain-containing protein [Olsenella sp. YH-ols2216]MDJ1129814.1 FtsK/SpoIIIE domain-containing protein [Olsenella sp. YH-ols2217]
MSALEASITVATSPLGHPLKVSLANGLLLIMQGASGCGKSAVLRNIIEDLCRVMGPLVQFVVVDPKQVSFLGFDARVHVFGNSGDWLRLTDSLLNEMRRRYAYMAKNRVRELEPTEERPFVVLVCDELSAVTADQTMLKKERDRLVSNLVQYSNQCRQASMGFMLSGQVISSETIPTVVRSNASTRIAMAVRGESLVNMISSDRPDECPCDLLTLPGEMYLLVPDGSNRWRRGRADWRDPQEQEARMARMAGDKRLPAFLDWESPEFKG